MCLKKQIERFHQKISKTFQLSDSILKISSEDLLRPTWMRRKELQRGQLVGESVDPWRMNGWWRDVTGWDLLRISGSSWMKPVTFKNLPSIFLFGKVIFTLLGQLGKSLSWRWKVGEKCPKWVETLVTLAYPNHLHYRCYLQRSTKLLCKGITTLGSTYKIGGSPS